MELSFIHSLQSEWLKKKRSLASWIVIIGSFFTPAIVTVVRIIYSHGLQPIYASDNFWRQLWKNSWESMAIFLLPLGVILATSLIAQIEYRNNTWKQLHTLPLNLATIFFSKLAIIIFMMLQFFVLFNIGIYLSALIPFLVVKGVSYPKAPFPFIPFLKEDALFFIDCLPVIALQYLISLKYKNFLVPVGLGFIFWIAAIGSLSWKYSYLIPYTYCMFNYLKGQTGGRAVTPALNIHWLAVGYFFVFTILSYILYITKKEKG
jgi:hypothetical protein